MSQGRTYGPPDVSAYCAWLGLGTEAPPGIRLNVVFTTREGTLAALMTASTLAHAISRQPFVCLSPRWCPSLSRWIARRFRPVFLRSSVVAWRRGARKQPN